MTKETSAIQLRILIAECLQAERDLARFLVICVNKYGPVLSIDEALHGRQLMERVSRLVDKIQAEGDTPPDKLPVYKFAG